MSEPKTVARETREIAPGVHHYSIHDERINHNSEAYAVVADGRAVLIDPVRLDPSAMARLGPVDAVVLATPGHQRAAWSLRRAATAVVHAPEEAAGLDEKPDHEFRDGTRLPGGLVAVHAPGPSALHHALHLERGPGLLFLGDLVMNEPHGLGFLPDKYSSDPARSRQSLRKLLDLRFGVVCFGHGAPMLEGGRQALDHLLKTDAGRH